MLIYVNSLPVGNLFTSDRVTTVGHPRPLPLWGYCERVVHQGLQ
jgi:hypothetical protein